MRIYVDQLEQELDLHPGLSLGEIIDKLCTQKIAEDRVITHVRVNGQDVVEDENGLFPDMPSGAIDSLELKTELSRDMVFQGVSDAKTYLEKLIPGIEKAAELFRVGEETKAHDQYGLCMEGLNWLIQVLKGVQHIMGLDYREMAFNRVSVQSYIENLEHIVREMLTAQSDEDWVMLSDLLEYELSPILTGWKEILPLIEGAARKADEGARHGKTAES